MFYHVEMYQMKCFISNCWQKKFSKLSQIFWCKIVWVPNCLFYTLGAKLSRCQIVWVQNCPFLTLGAKLAAFGFWCQIVLQSDEVH